MNIYELNEILDTLQRDPLGNKDIIAYYKKKRTELMNILKKKINEELAKV